MRGSKDTETCEQATPPRTVEVKGKDGAGSSCKMCGQGVVECKMAR